MTQETQEVQEVETTEVETQVVETEEVKTEEPTQEGEPAAQEAEAPEATKSEEDKKQDRAGFWERQKRQKDKLTQLEEEKEYFRKLAMQAQQPVQAVQPNTQVDPYMPNLDTYLENGRSMEDYLNDRDAYIEQKRQQAETINSAKATYSQKMEEYAASVPDVYNMARDVETVTIPAVQQAIMRARQPGQIIQRIHEDPSLASKLNGSIDVFDLANKIAEIESKQPNIKQTFSSAPKPQSQPKGEPIQSGRPDPSKMSKAEYFEWRNSQRSK